MYAPTSYCTNCAADTYVNPGDKCARCHRPYTLVPKVAAKAHTKIAGWKHLTEESQARNAADKDAFKMLPGIRGIFRYFRTLRRHKILVGIPSFCVLGLVDMAIGTNLTGIIGFLFFIWLGILLLAAIGRGSIDSPGAYIAANRRGGNSYQNIGASMGHSPEPRFKAPVRGPVYNGATRQFETDPGPWIYAPRQTTPPQAPLGTVHGHPWER